MCTRVLSFACVLSGLDWVLITSRNHYLKNVTDQDIEADLFSDSKKGETDSHDVTKENHP